MCEDSSEHTVDMCEASRPYSAAWSVIASGEHFYPRLLSFLSLFFNNITKREKTSQTFGKSSLLTIKKRL